MRLDRSRLWGGLAFAGALVVGGVAGATLGTPSVSGAAAGAPVQQEAADEIVRSVHPAPGHHVDLDAAAEALDLDEDELRDRLDGGDTIADVAEAEGVPAQDVIDAMVAAGSAAIDEMAAEMKERLPELVEGLVEGDFPAVPHRPFGFHEWIEPMARLEVAAEALGMSTDELLDALRGGSTLAEVAEDRGVEVDTLVGALTREARAQIAQAVEDGDLDEDDAAELRDGLEERIRDRVEGDGVMYGPDLGPPGPGFGGHGFGPGFGPRG